MSAYTTVTTARSFGAFGSHNYTPSPAPPPSKAKKIDWPSSVREYVQRCFAAENKVPGVELEDMQTRLKQIINEAAEQERLTSMDWEHLPLPQQMIQNERVAAVNSKPLLPFYMPEPTPFVPPVPTNKTPSRKRKSAEMVQNTEPVASPPWHRKEDVASPSSSKSSKQERQEKRQRKFHDEHPMPQSSKSNTELEKRRQRFNLDARGHHSSPLGASREDTPTTEFDAGPVIGVCQDIEKKYFRLTAPPKPETVRPLPVLRKTLTHLKQRWREDSNYSYICDQFKSLRQDLTVQHIKTDFTVNVYEVHARIALEKGDLGEYNQCQSQLRALYNQALGGHPAEFLAYRILYFIYTGNRTDMSDLLAELTPEDRKQPAVQHALNVRSSLALGNYHRFFRLQHDTPNMGAYLIDMFITRERLAALAQLCKAFKPDVKLSFITEMMGFDSDKECAEFICDHGGESLLDRQDDGIIKFASGKAGSIFESAKVAAFRRVDIKGQI